MDTCYTGSMLEEEENIFEWRTNGLNIDSNGLFFATLAGSIALMVLLRVSSYSNLF
ncbi:MAG: hypothetical protein GQ576_06460 [Methanococcoides sp.]|nr:hypothetical protein [Methanococcoides sp.]